MEAPGSQSLWRLLETRGGLTLLEVVVALTIVSILMGMAVLGFQRLEDSLQSRNLARQLASALRKSRAQAVATNREFRVKFLADGATAGDRPVFWLQRGNLSRESTAWEDLFGTQIQFPPHASMGFTSSCQTDSSPRYISFNPDGSSNSLYVCIKSTDGSQPPQKAYAVGVSHASTGRVLILKWNRSASRFE
jgi:prepilin-type N-terminal cleavage/methylation domain-containing protein